MTALEIIEKIRKENESVLPNWITNKADLDALKAEVVQLDQRAKNWEHKCRSLRRQVNDFKQKAQI